MTDGNGAYRIEELRPGTYTVSYTLPGFSVTRREGVELFPNLRHTACTRLLERGASLPIVASILGWSPSTTAKMAKRYGHIGNNRATGCSRRARTPETGTEHSQCRRGVRRA